MLLVPSPVACPPRPASSLYYGPGIRIFYFEKIRAFKADKTLSVLGDLSPVQRNALDELMKLPPNPGRSPGADRFQYKVQLLDSGAKREFEVPEDAMPDELASIAKIEP
jgi:hypothetical protein